MRWAAAIGVLVLCASPSARAQDCRRNCRANEVVDGSTGCCKPRPKPPRYRPRYTRPAVAVTPIRLGPPPKLEKLGLSLPAPAIGSPCAIRPAKLSGRELETLERRLRLARPRDRAYWELQHQMAAALFGGGGLAAARKVYARIERDAPSYARFDAVLAEHAQLELAANDAGRARQLYSRLIKSYPASRHIPCAYYTFGQHFARTNAHANAERFFEKVAQFPNSDTYLYGLYMQGVSALALREQRAIELLSSAAVKAHKAGNATLASAAESRVIDAFALLEKPATAARLFRRFREPQKMLGALHDQWLDAGEIRKALELLPLMTARCDLLRAGAHNALAAGSSALPDLIGALARATADPKAECAGSAVAVFEAAARQAHAAANQSKAAADIDRAIALYDLHIARATGSRELASTLLRAELLWARAQLETDPRRAAAGWAAAAAAFLEASKHANLDAAGKRKAVAASNQATANFKIAARFAR